AGAGRAGRVELSQAGTEEAWIVPFLELVVIGVAIEAEAVREQVADGRAVLVAGGELQIRRIARDGRVKIDLALLGELGDHRRGDAFRDRRPAEDRLRSHGISRAGLRLAIALEEGDA